MAPRSRPTRRTSALALGAVALAGLSLASASQLAVDGGALQAGATVVAGCQPAGQPVAVSFTSTFSAGAYRTSAVVFSGLDAGCDGATYRVQLVGAGGAPIDMNGAGPGADLGGLVSLSGGAFSVSIASVPTASISSVALVLEG